MVYFTINQSINQKFKTLYVDPDSPIHRRSRSLGRDDKSSFEQINVSTVSPREFQHLAGRLFQTVAEVCRKDRSAKVEWARFTTSRFSFNTTY